MTTSTVHDDGDARAKALIDDWLGRTPHREQFSAGEVEDLLLDLRGLLFPATPVAVSAA